MAEEIINLKLVLKKLFKIKSNKEMKNIKEKLINIGDRGSTFNISLIGN